MDIKDFLENVKSFGDDIFKRERYIKQVAKTEDIPVKELRDVVNKELKNNKNSKNDDDLDYAIFVSELIENAKNGIVGNIPIFFDITAGKYLFTIEESRTDENGRVENYKKLEFIDVSSVKKIIQEHTKRTINNIIKSRDINQIVEWIPAYFKGYNPHKPEFYNITNSSILTKNMCVLPEHFYAIKNNTNTKKSYIEILEQVKVDTPHIYTLLQNLFVKDEYIAYFLNWLAYTVQFLRKTRNAIVLVGEQGTGKGVLWENIITWIFNQDNCVVVSNSDIRSNFNVIFDNRLFVCFNEIKAELNERSIIYETLKQYITDSDFMVNVKNVSQYRVENHFNCIFFSNHEVPVQIEGSDRRYSVFKTSATKLKDLVGDTSLFIENLKIEREIFLSLLFQVDVDVKYACSLMETEQKAKIKELSNTKQDILKSKIYNKDIEYFDEKIDEFIEGIEDERAVNRYKVEVDGSKVAEFFTRTNKEMKKEFLINLQTGVFSAEVLKWLYKFFVNENDTENKIMRFWNYVFVDSFRLGTKKRVTVKALENAEKAIIWGSVYVRNGNKWIEAGDTVEIVIKDVNDNVVDEKIEEIPF